MDNKTLFITISLAVFLISPDAFSGGNKIYKYVDKDGHITFSNKPIKGGKLFLNTPGPSRNSPQSQEVQRNFPKVNLNTQNKRDIKRREILQQELSNEQNLLSELQSKLSSLDKVFEKNPNSDNIKHLQEKIRHHKNNITALKKELANL